MDLKKPDRPSTASPLGKPNLVLSNVSAATKIRHRNTINSTITTMPLNGFKKTRSTQHGVPPGQAKPRPLERQRSYKNPPNTINSDAIVLYLMLAQF